MGGKASVTGFEMLSRRIMAAWLYKTTRSRRVLGIILVSSGLLLWVIAALMPIALLEKSIGVVFGGAVVMIGLILIVL